MSNVAEDQDVSDLSSVPDRRALDFLFEELAQLRADRDAAEARVVRFEETIRHLIESLPPDQRDPLNRRLTDPGKSGATGRGGAVFGNVIALFRARPRPVWSVPDIQDALAQDGTAPDDPKAVYNVISYLARTGRLHRVARGRYVFRDNGAGLEFDDVPDDGTVRRSENDD